MDPTASAAGDWVEVERGVKREGSDLLI